MISVRKVEPLDNYQILLEFSNNEKGIFDMIDYLEHGKFSSLKENDIFKTVRISYDTIQWSNGLDLCPEVLYEKCTKL